MEHGARLNANRIIAIVIIFMAVIILLSLIVNIIQGINNGRLQNEQRTVQTPMLYDAPFAVSQNQADASYLRQMALSFVALRLNVTPETVDASHAALLNFVKPAAQNELKVKLAEDAKRIKGNNVNSAFYQTSVKVYPMDGRIDIRGELKTWIGNSQPYSEIKHYVLILERTNGMSWLSRFGEVNNENK
ncbi:type IV conjugative transfer system protein TraE [Xenorhabdus sp. XENO-1]|uniref:type IV conjugative transfer system protein TraE n=1 Tax=Xenorhabdus bovienii TaxID=40576 RepID=UPI0020CA9B85|nr:type IV conjugative transfer system protein TraE [Xenorhabdus bovienii]MCP9269140.1 type IV conjugative transfer system protein TraE [Xenorhabdus bovienii subsp. africana]